MKQHEAVILTLEKLGGQATLGELYQSVMKIKDCEWKTRTPFASIRRIVQLRPEIFKVRPGLYALKELQTKLGLKEYQPEIPENEENREQSHSYFQGLLLELGNIRKFSTFVPNQDKNKVYVNKHLDVVRTLKEIPHFSFDYIVNRAKTIDVIWFNDRKLPDSFFEVEHSTDIQNSLMKFFELRDFYVKMVIVADEHRKNEYEHRIQHGALSEISDRVHFLGYETLAKLYELEIFKSSSGFII
jgi:hypothetical protein